jgi:hypothetical protein
VLPGMSGPAMITEPKSARVGLEVVFLQKPFTGDDLAVTVRTVLDAAAA